MQIGELLAGVNWLAVIVATVVAFGLGALWYSKALFADAWMQEVGLTEEAINNANMGKVFGLTFLLQIISATGLSVFVGPSGNWLDGLLAGLAVGLVWVATAYGVTYLFEQRPLRLWLINAGYYVVWYSLTGLIIGAWP